MEHKNLGLGWQGSNNHQHLCEPGMGTVWVGPGLSTPSTHKSKYRVWAVSGWVRLQHPSVRTETVGELCQAESEHPPVCTICGARNGPVRGIYGLLLGAGPTGKCTSQGHGRIRLGKATAPAGAPKSQNGCESCWARLVHLLSHMRALAVGQAGLGSNIHQ